MASQAHHNHQPQIGNVAKIKGEQQQQQIKYLGFLHVASAQALMWWSAGYCYAKETSGALRPGIQTVEECVKSVVGSVHDKFHLVPDEILCYVDQKHDTSVAIIQGAPPVAEATVIDAVKNFYAKYEPSANELYERYEPMVDQYAASTWRRLNTLPLFLHMVKVVLPKAAYCMRKYNEAVMAAAEKGYRVSPYLGFQ